MPVELARLEAIFSDALAKSTPAERDTFLDQACGSDLGLRGHIERLLASYNDAGSFMAPPDPDRTVESHIPIQEKPGSTIGRYKLLEQIGEGGFGVVFMAEQEQPVRRRVALKIIKLGMDTKQVVARFEAERQALAMMDHPNIAKVLDGGSTDSGRPYFVMELVKGIPITEYCDQQELSTRDRLELFVDVCKAVQHAHQRGVIHRDIKPSNVLLTLHDDKAVPKVIDFGIAKATQARLTEKTLFTEYRQLIGTPAYMSPEQAQMTGLDVDTRSDIYSLGVMLYELLTGSTPFDSRQLSGGLDEMRRIIREVEPPPPSSRLSTLGADRLGIVAHQRHCDPQRLGRLVQGDLDWIVMRCLEKDRTRRYDTAVGLAEDIQRHLSDEPVQACPPSAAYRVRKLVRRNRLAFVAAGAVTAALVFGLGVSTWMFFRERDARARAVAAEQAQGRLRIRAETDEKKARTEAAKSQQVAQFLKDMLKGIEPSVAMGRDTTMLREILDETAQRVDKDLKDQPEVQIELRLTLANTYHELGLYQQMEQMARGTLLLARSTLGEENLAVANALGQIADALGHLSRYPEAVPLNRQSIAMLRKLHGGDSLEEAYALYHLCFGLSSQGKHAEAESTARAALAMRRKLLGAEHPDVARSLDGLSRMLMTQQKLVEAEAAARESLDMRLRLLGNENPELGRSLEILGAVLKREGKHAEAEELYRQLLPGLRKTMGENHPRVAAAYSNLSDALGGLNRLEESEAARHEAITIMNRALADFPEQRQSNLEPQAHSYRLLGYRYWGRRDHSGARELFTRATDLFRQAAESGAPKAIATALQGEADNSLCIGQLWEAESRGAEANEAFHQALALHERLEKEGRAQDITAGWVANHYIQLAQLIEKVATLEDALRIAQILHVPKKGLSAAAMNGLVDCHFQLARVLQKHGQAKEAIQHLQNLCASLPADDLSSARAEFNLANILRQNGKPAEAAQAGLRAAEKCHKVLPEYEKLTADRSRHHDCWNFAIAYEQLAQLLIELGHKKEAEGVYRDAQVIWIQLVDAFNIEDHRWHLAVNHDVLGHLLRDAGRLDEAAGSYQQALAIWEKLASETKNLDRHIHLSWTRLALAGVLRTQGRSEEEQALLRDAEAGCREAMDICEQRPKDVDPAMQLGVFNSLNAVMTARGDTSTLQDAATQTVQNLRARTPTDEGSLAVALANLANILRKDGKLADARPLAEEAVAICQRQTGQVDPWIQDHAFDALRHVLTQLGDTAALATLAVQSITHAERAGNADQLATAYAGAIPLLMAGGRQYEIEDLCRKLVVLAPTTGGAENNVAWFLATAENPAYREPALAVELAKKAVELNPKSASWWNTLGSAHYRAGEWPAALEALGKSMELRKGGDAFDWFFLAMTHWQLGSRAEALKWYDQAVAWMDQNQPNNEELRRFRAEAGELIAEPSPATQP